MPEIICVGAVYIDTILTVPHFPLEDEKLRASKLTRRRGGNCANTLEVLEQLIQLHPEDSSSLQLLSVFPNKQSDAVKFISDSLKNVKLESSIFRDDSQEAASSYIIKSEEKRTRTIVSINELSEMTLEEFVQGVGQMLLTHDVPGRWYHFEGREPEFILSCVKWLRVSHKNAIISVELEKPNRVRMKEVAALADVVFYSRLWAESHSFKSAKEFLEAQIPCTQENAILCCTWGSGGATALQKSPEGFPAWASVEAWAPQDHARQVIDTIGAGDTFIAGMIFTLAYDFGTWSLKDKLSFANELAGRKVIQEGFCDLASHMTLVHSSREDQAR